jgi:hypothetical protein
MTTGDERVLDDAWEKEEEVKHAGHMKRPILGR